MRLSKVDASCCLLGGGFRGGGGFEGTSVWWSESETDGCLFFWSGVKEEILCLRRSCEG